MPMLDTASALRIQERIQRAPYKERTDEYSRWLGYHVHDEKPDVWLNLWGVTRQLSLLKIERAFVALRLATIPDTIPVRLDEDGMREIHHYLYQDLYPWAGELRTIGLRPNEVGTGMDAAPALWERLEATDNMRLMDGDDIPAALADFYVRVLHLRGFIQGNEVVAKMMTNRCAQATGRSIDWTKLGTLKDLTHLYLMSKPRPLQEAMQRAVQIQFDQAPLQIGAPLGYTLQSSPVPTPAPTTLDGTSDLPPIPAQRVLDSADVASLEAQLAQVELLKQRLESLIASQSVTSSTSASE